MKSAATTLKGSSSSMKVIQHNEKHQQGTVYGETHSSSATATATTEAATRTTQTTTKNHQYYPSWKMLSRKNKRKLRRKIRIAEDTLQYMTAGLFFL